MEPLATSAVTLSSTTSAPSAAPTLIHFKRNSQHAVSQALAVLKWNEVRLKIPKSQQRKKRQHEGKSVKEKADINNVKANENTQQKSERKEEEEQESDDDDEEEEEQISVESPPVESPSASALSDVFSVRAKVKQPDSLLLNIPKTLRWNIAWLDVLSESEYQHLLPSQHINQFPSMHRLSKKKYLAMNLNRMAQVETKEYGFYPRSWILPKQANEVKEWYEKHTNATTPILIVKPDFACEGVGIYLVDSYAAIDLSIPLVIQEYIPRPLLVNSMKFDLRLYVLITSLAPLSIFLFSNGLTRFCTDAYTEPSFGKLGTRFQHLTNYAINQKNEEKFVYNTSETKEEEGSKWSVKSLMKRLLVQGDTRAGENTTSSTSTSSTPPPPLSPSTESTTYTQHDLDQLWLDIQDLIVKSILSSYGTLQHAYKTTFTGGGGGGSSSSSAAASSSASTSSNSKCFQFLGFDILLTKGNPTSSSSSSSATSASTPSVASSTASPSSRAIIPHLIEINRNCSLKCDTPLDSNIKVSAIKQTFEMVLLSSSSEKGEKKTKEMLMKERDELRRLSAADYKRVQAEQQLARSTAILQKENEICQKYVEMEKQGMEAGAWQRIHPLPHNPERQAVYDRLMTVSTQLHEDSGMTVGKKKSSTSGGVTARGAVRKPVGVTRTPVESTNVVTKSDLP